jgi:ABC-type nitrate/sulfonate/bicarbonate transport system ATPase subunit
MGTRPGRIIAEVTIDLPRPRRVELLQDEAFFALTSRLTGMLLADGGAA